MAVIQATGGEVTRTALVERSLDMFLRVLELEPTMIPQNKNAPQSDKD